MITTSAEEDYERRINEAARQKELLEEEERQRQQREAREKYNYVQKNFPPNTILAMAEHFRKEAAKKERESAANKNHSEKMSMYRSLNNYIKNPQLGKDNMLRTKTPTDTKINSVPTMERTISLK